MNRWWYGAPDLVSLFGGPVGACSYPLCVVVVGCYDALWPVIVANVPRYSSFLPLFCCPLLSFHFSILFTFSLFSFFLSSSFFSPYLFIPTFSFTFSAFSFLSFGFISLTTPLSCFLPAAPFPFPPLFNFLSPFRFPSPLSPPLPLPHHPPLLPHSLIPDQSWYGFTPTIKYNYLKEEDAEEEFSKRNKVMSRFSTMVRKRMNDDKEDEDNDDDDDTGGGSGKKQGKDKGGKCAGEGVMREG